MVPHETVEDLVNKALGHGDDARHIAIVGVPDEAKGEALVILSSNPDIDLQALRVKLTEEGIPALWIPKKIVDVPRSRSWPRASSTSRAARRSRAPRSDRVRSGTAPSPLLLRLTSRSARRRRPSPRAVLSRRRRNATRGASPRSRGWRAGGLSGWRRRPRPPRSRCLRRGRRPATTTRAPRLRDRRSRKRRRAVGSAGPPLHLDAVEEEGDRLRAQRGDEFPLASTAAA